MDIYWLGHGCFRLRGREATVLSDPCPPSTGYRIGRVAADVVTISSASPESNYRQAVTGEAKFITGPGEYEIRGVPITGIRTRPAAPRGAAPERNVAYVIEVDEVRVCHLGNLSHVPSADDVEVLATADVLIIPVGGGRVLDAGRAAETVSLLEPKIVIPMMYKTEAALAELDPVEKFLREMGVEAKAPEPRLSVTKGSLPHDTVVVLLSYRGA